MTDWPDDVVNTIMHAKNLFSSATVISTISAPSSLHYTLHTRTVTYVCCVKMRYLHEILCKDGSWKFADDQIRRNWMLIRVNGPVVNTTSHVHTKVSTQVNFTPSTSQIPNFPSHSMVLYSGLVYPWQSYFSKIGNIIPTISNQSPNLFLSFRDLHIFHSSYFLIIRLPNSRANYIN